MAREMGPEEAIKHLVCFADNRRDFFGFGVDMGPGLPTKSTMLLYRMYDDPTKQNIILIEEDDPFVVMWRIDFEIFKKHLRHIISLARAVEEFNDVSLVVHHKIQKAAFLVHYEMLKATFPGDVFEMVDAVNHLIELLRDYFSREQILFVAE